ncbi:unnamed protein product [Camellia sinensis]
MNASRGLCQCETDEWKTIHKELWSSVMSPYEDRYVDMKFVDKIASYVTVTVDKEFQRWHLFCLAFGFVLLLLAPVVSSWVPFYYSSSMAVGVFLVIIILLFQRAALGYWMVQKLVTAEDGSVDVGIAQFVKWAMRVIAATFIFQSTLDTPLAMGALASCLSICFLITFFKWSGPESGMVASRGTLWNSPRRSSGWSDSPVKGTISPTTGRVTRNQHDYYSTFHRSPNRSFQKKKKWENFTQESTLHAVAELASSPKFIDWITKHADSIQLLPGDSSDNTIGSGSDSTDEYLVEIGDRFSLFKW